MWSMRIGSRVLWLLDVQVVAQIVGETLHWGKQQGPSTG
jgi:hypothetical protein